MSGPDAPVPKLAPLSRTPSGEDPSSPSDSMFPDDTGMLGRQDEPRTPAPGKTGPGSALNPRAAGRRSPFYQDVPMTSGIMDRYSSPLSQRADKPSLLNTSNTSIDSTGAVESRSASASPEDESITMRHDGLLFHTEEEDSSSIDCANWLDPHRRMSMMASSSAAAPTMPDALPAFSSAPSAQAPAPQRLTHQQQGPLAPHGHPAGQQAGFSSAAAAAAAYQPVHNPLQPMQYAQQHEFLQRAAALGQHQEAWQPSFPPTTLPVTPVAASHVTPSPGLMSGARRLMGLRGLRDSTNVFNQEGREASRKKSVRQLLQSESELGEDDDSMQYMAEELAARALPDWAARAASPAPARRARAAPAKPAASLSSLGSGARRGERAGKATGAKRPKAGRLESGKRKKSRQDIKGKGRDRGKGRAAGAAASAADEGAAPGAGDAAGAAAAAADEVQQAAMVLASTRKSRGAKLAARAVQESKARRKAVEASSSRAVAELPRNPRMATRLDNWRRAAYAPFLDCTQHNICIHRRRLGLKGVAQGKYAVEELTDKFMKKVVMCEIFNSKNQLCQRTDEIEDDVDGRFNLMQLHLAQCMKHSGMDRRPLLLPNLESAISPPQRLLTSNKLFCGRFFEANGALQKDDCILMVFPKNHRGSVRLQLKVWNQVMRKISTNVNKDDCKAHFLSYVLWLFGLGGQHFQNLGQWPKHVKATCEFGRTGRNVFQNDEFLCVNPCHYLADNPVGVRNMSQLQKNITEHLTDCFKDEPPLPGELPNPATGRSYCFCTECRYSQGLLS